MTEREAWEAYWDRAEYNSAAPDIVGSIARWMYRAALLEGEEASGAG